MNVDQLMCVTMILSTVGGICLGALWQARKVQRWRIRCIVLEHARAYALDQRPRHIDAINWDDE